MFRILSIWKGERYKTYHTDDNVQKKAGYDPAKRKFLGINVNNYIRGVYYENS